MEGGVSTRPGSVEPSEEEELQRVIPLVKAIRESKNPALRNVLISVDTYRSNVAEESLNAGADIINDISMGKYDDMMFDVIALYGCPYIMNHTRGTPKTMSKLTNNESNTNDDLVEHVIDPKMGHQGNLEVATDSKNLLNGISRELSLQMFKAMAKGVKKWQIIVDPGVGFAKNLHQNLDIIRHASFFKKYSIQVNERVDDTVRHKYLSFNGMPVLVGTSRKKFLGTLTGKENDPLDRVLATAATVTASIEQNTNIVRVHDVKEMKDVVLTSDAIYRSI